MTAVFEKVLNMSLTGSIVIGVVLLARLLLKRAPKIYAYALWAAVLFRLLCPISLSAGMSVLKPLPVTTTEGLGTVTYRPVQTVIQTVDFTPSDVSQVDAQPEKAKTDPTPMEIAAGVWLAGGALMAAYSLVQYLVLRRKLREAVPYQGEIYLADNLSTPFVMGVIAPKIYLPSDTPEAERRFIIAHERQHVRRGDPLWKLLGYVALCIHWFNPLVWLAFLLGGKDMEMSCDEAVINRLGADIRADYSQALLRLATHKRLIAGMPLAFGEGDTRGRVRNMARWKRPKVWASGICAVLCLVVLAACALNPRKTEEQQPTENPTLETTSSGGKIDMNLQNLHLTLPDGCTYEGFENHQPWDINRDNYEYTLKEGDTAIGGVRLFTVPKDISGANWLEELVFPEWGMENVGYSAGGNLTSGYTVEFFSDVPEGQPKTLRNLHNVYQWEDRIYDVWFDELTVSPETELAILDSIRLGAGSIHIPASLPLDITALPDDVGWKSGEYGAILLTKDGETIGSIDTYDIPESVENPYADFDWLAEAGVSDADVQEVLAKELILTGGSSLYGDWEIEVESDVMPGQPQTVKRWHTFFIADRKVYDVWFDLTKVSEGEYWNLMSLMVNGVPEETTAATQDRSGLAYWGETFQSDDGTVTFQADVYYDPAQLTGEGVMTPAELLAAVKREMQVGTMDYFGLGTKEMGYTDVECFVNLTGLHLEQRQEKLVLVVEGLVIYRFSDGNTIGQELGIHELMALDARDGSFLSGYGRAS